MRRCCNETYFSNPPFVFTCSVQQDFYMEDVVHKPLCTATLIDLPTLFRNESYMYGQALPVVEPYGPVCIYHDERNIIMEDSTDKGYIHYDNFLDATHAVSSLKVITFSAYTLHNLSRSSMIMCAAHLIAMFVMSIPIKREASAGSADVLVNAVLLAICFYPLETLW